MVLIIGFCLIIFVPTLTPPETGGELTNPCISVAKSFNP
jgi:hypothetical protein